MYNKGTVEFVCGEKNIRGINTNFLSNVRVGDYIVFDGSVDCYLIEKVVSDDNLELFTKINGKDGNKISGVSYKISDDFTPNVKMPIPKKHDRDPQSLVNRALKIIDIEIPV